MNIKFLVIAVVLIVGVLWVSQGGDKEVSALEPGSGLQKRDAAGGQVDVERLAVPLQNVEVTTVITKPEEVKSAKYVHYEILYKEAARMRDPPAAAKLFPELMDKDVQKSVYIYLFQHYHLKNATVSAGRSSLFPENFTGRWRDWYVKGNLISDCNYKDGEPVGLAQRYYENQEQASAKYWKKGQVLWGWTYSDENHHVRKYLHDSVEDDKVRGASAWADYDAGGELQMLLYYPRKNKSEKIFEIVVYDKRKNIDNRKQQAVVVSNFNKFDELYNEIKKMENDGLLFDLED